MRSRLSIATFNAFNLVDADRPFYEERSYTVAEYDMKCNWMASQLDKIDADVVALQEIWSEKALLDVVSRSERMRNAKLVCAPGAGPENNKPRVGIISHLPLTQAVESIDSIPASLAIELPIPTDPMLPVQPRVHQSFSRPVLKLNLNLAEDDEAAKTLVMFVLHLKSKRSERYTVEIEPGLIEGEDLSNPFHQARGNLRSLIMRGVEATALRHLVLDTFRETISPIMVLGDFNDTVNAITTQIIAGRSSQLDEAGRDYRLYSASNLDFFGKANRAEGYISAHQGDPNTLDHILVSEEFKANSKRAVYQLTTFSYFSDHLNDLKSTQSDHGIVRAVFNRKLT